MRRSRESAHPTNDLLFGWFYAAAIGGSVLALYFLVVDMVAGQPLFTPGLMGERLFGGPGGPGGVPDDRADLTAVSLFSIVHLVAFSVVGFLGSLLYRAAVRNGWPADAVVFVTLFTLMEVGFIVASATLLDGVLMELGVVVVTVGNLLAAAAMTGLLWWEYHRTVTRRYEETTPAGV